MKLDKMAAQDASTWLTAEMGYGEGSGTRRKIVGAEIQGKMNDIPGYEEAFDAAYQKLDLTKYAQAAVKERKALDRAAKAGQNFRALKSGNFNNLSTGVFVVVGVAFLLHQTGYDKVLEQKAKEGYKRLKAEIKFRRMRAQGLNVERIYG